MNAYYIAGFPISDELCHHGIKGQKWGIRRYQNEDGTLTETGKKRYGNNLGEYANKESGLIRKLATGDWALGGKRLGEKREDWYKSRIDKRKEKGKSTHTVENLHTIQKARNIGRDIYNSHASTGKLVLQSLLLGQSGADSYRSARGRGRDVGEAAVGAILGQAIAVTAGLVSPSLGSVASTVGAGVSYMHDYKDTRKQKVQRDNSSRWA